MTDVLKRIDEAVALTKGEEYLRALTMFLEIYGSEEPPSPMLSSKTATGLSYFGLCLAMMERKFKPAIDLCKLAIELQFYNPDHYANLAQVYIAAGHRKKAIDIVEQGLRSHAEDQTLRKVRRQLGVRAKPPVPFLDRAHPINVTLGQARHAKKASSKEPKKK
jgi:tetratricopeptide (TPR) repeat protein